MMQNQHTVVALVVPIAGATATNASADSVTLWRGKQAIEYALVNDEIALLGTSAGERADTPQAQRVTTFLSAHHGWSLAPQEGTQFGGMRDFVDQAITVRRADYAAPILLLDADRGLHGVPMNTLLVGFVDDADEEAQRRALRLAGLTGAEPIDSWSHVRSVRSVRTSLRSGFDVLDVAGALAQMDIVRFAEPDMLFEGRSSFTPNDPEYTNGSQWGLHNTGQNGGVSDIDIDAPEAWNTTTGAPGIRVVVIDTGVQLDHPDMVIAGGADFTSDGPAGGGAPTNSFEKHGTPTAGIIGATIDNGIGVAGIASGVSLYSARCFIGVSSDGSWTASASWTVDALNWAASLSARVTVNSNHYGFTSAAIESAYADTRTNGLMLHFASAGNDSAVGATYPASLSSVHAISAINRTGSLASFSNTGPDIALCGPGVDVHAPDRTGADGYNLSDYVFFSGTSAAAPVVGGVAALVLSANSTLNVLQTEQLLFGQARDLGPFGDDDEFGAGLPSAANAIAAIPTVLPTQSCSHGRDIIDDGNVDGGDLATLLAQWGPIVGAPSDLNGDYIVDGSDLAILLSVWGPCQ